MVRAMERGQPGRRYLLGHENLSIRELFTLLAHLTGLPEPNRRVPYALALAVAYLSEFWADVVSHRPPAATVTGVKLTRRVMHFDARRSLDRVGLGAATGGQGTGRGGSVVSGGGMVVTMLLFDTAPTLSNPQPGARGCWQSPCLVLPQLRQEPRKLLRSRGRCHHMKVH